MAAWFTRRGAPPAVKGSRQTLSSTHCTGHILGNVKYQGAKRLGPVGEAAHQEAAQGMILPHCRQHLLEKGRLNHDVHRQVALLPRARWRWAARWFHHQQFPGVEGHLLPVVNQVPGLPGYHVHHFHIIVPVPWKGGKPGYAAAREIRFRRWA